MEIKYTLKGADSIALCFIRLSNIVDILDFEDNDKELGYLDNIKENIKTENIDVIKNIDDFMTFAKIKYGHEKRHILMEALRELRLSIIFTEPFLQKWEQLCGNISSQWTRKIE